MVTPTRRALLRGAAGLTTALAGCSGVLDGSTESTQTASRDDSDGGPGSGKVSDPETLLLRVDTDRPPVWLAAEHSEADSRPTPSERDRLHESIVVDDSARAARLRVYERVHREPVASFLAATDFATETVYVEMSEIEDCFRLELCHVSWTSSKVSTDYTRRSRPYTDRCSVDESAVEARLIRIPDALDADDVNSYSSSAGTGPCDRHQGPAGAAGESGSRPASESVAPSGAGPTDVGGGQ